MRMSGLKESFYGVHMPAMQSSPGFSVLIVLLELTAYCAQKQQTFQMSEAESKGNGGR